MSVYKNIREWRPYAVWSLNLRIVLKYWRVFKLYVGHIKIGLAGWDRKLKKISVREGLNKILAFSGLKIVAAVK